jgi:hypothetical protein
MSDVNISYSAADKKFSMGYTYQTKRRQTRAVSPKPRTFSSLATQVLRAKDRNKQVNWQNPVSNPALSIEGNNAEAYLYRYENGNVITVRSGTLVEVLRYADMLKANGTEEHKTALKTMQVNVNITPTPQN